MSQDLIWNPDVDWDRYAWVAFLVCPDCGGTWRGLFEGERPGTFGPVEEQCPDCEYDL